MNLKTKKTGNTTTVKIEGPLTIEHAIELKTFISNIYANPEDIVMDLDDVTEIDLSCIQLICSANLSFEKSRKQLIRKSVLPEEITHVLYEAGYKRDPRYHGTSCKKCFWNDGEK